MRDWEYAITTSFTGDSGERAVTEVITLPSTRNASVLVTVTNQLGIPASCALANSTIPSGTSDAITFCPIAFASATGTTQAVLAELEDALALDNATGGEITSLLLASTDLLHATATQNDSLVDQLTQTFVGIVTEPSSHEISTFQSVEVLAELVGFASSSSESTDLLLVAIEAIGHSLQGAGSSVADDSTAQQFVGVVGQFASGNASNIDVSVVSTLDTALAAACGSSHSGQPAFDETEMFTLSCFQVFDNEFAAGSTESGAVVVGGNANVSTLTISSWNHDELVESTNMDSLLLLSDVYGIHAQLSSGEPASEVSDIGQGYELSFQLKESSSASSGASSAEALRKTLSCEYYDPHTGTWSPRGVVLKGIQLTAFDDQENQLNNASWLVAGGLQLSVLCTSTHLTLFSIANNSETTQIIEGKINELSNRVDEIGSVDFSDPSAQVNWIVLTVFGVVTLLFALVVVATKLSQRGQAVATARNVFTQRGKLERSAVIGSGEYVWTLSADTVVFLCLD